MMERLDAVKRYSKNGGEYWMGRDLQPILGYDKWENFKHVIQKAREACRSAGIETKYHFLDTGKVITAGKGAQLVREDFFLTRYGCYTQTEERLKQEQIKSGDRAESVHNEVGRKVRDAIRNIGGTLPENLPAEPSLKKLTHTRKRRLLDTWSQQA